jgi:hypothetical protein
MIWAMMMGINLGFLNQLKCFFIVAPMIKPKVQMLEPQNVIERLDFQHNEAQH